MKNRCFDFFRVNLLILPLLIVFANVAVARSSDTDVWYLACRGQGETHRGVTVTEVRAQIELDFRKNWVAVSVLEKTIPPFNPEVVDNYKSEFQIEWSDSGMSKKDDKILVLQVKPINSSVQQLDHWVAIKPIDVPFDRAQHRPSAVPDGKLLLKYHYYEGYDDGSGERGPGNWIDKGKYSRDLECVLR